MHQFQVEFSKPLIAVGAPSVSVTTVHVDPAPEPKQTDSAALHTVQAAVEALKQAQQTINARLSAIDEQIVSAAVSIAQSVLNSDQDLIAKRVVDFARIGMSTVTPKINLSIHVHPECLESINEWATEAEVADARIVSDPSVAKGDCRIQSGDHGVMLALDAYLAAYFQQLVESGTHEPNDSRQG